MARLDPFSESDLELALLRKGVARLGAGRCDCADCGRTPLEGETVHHYGRGIVVCALCRPRRREAPEHSAPVWHSERGQTVRLRARAA